MSPREEAEQIFAAEFAEVRRLQSELRQCIAQAVELSQTMISIAFDTQDIETLSALENYFRLSSTGGASFEGMLH